MGDDSKGFIDKNKEIVLEEISSSLSAMNSVIGAFIEDEIAIEKSITALSYHVGNITSLFNEFNYLYTETFPEKEHERPIGFQSVSSEE